MTSREKLITKIKLAITLRRIIEADKTDGSKSAIDSLRKLAAASEIEYSIIQKISSAKKDPQFTTLMSISEGLNMTIDELLTGIKKVTDSEVRDYQNSLLANKLIETKKVKRSK